jgi:apolipoprotein N-acyltransferase
MDHDATSDRVLRATLQPGRVATPYARWGDVFPWLCAFALPPVAALGWWRARRRGPVEAGAAT